MAWTERTVWEQTGMIVSGCYSGEYVQIEIERWGGNYGISVWCDYGETKEALTPDELSESFPTLESAQSAVDALLGK